ncbi:hypothetical protein I7I53_03336 [Histoplasma capsulatum var. duboisii H88]|uniref:Uncharacterized protein n=1 Tax=Ajellomyces capsulatus (strain H88) TaxID=544711 RepID=A0A8A1LNC8_AJEC8|nr:hypothetical protein I7I53_03336 [Histoplasma capsulatum var. duboisii H88]
MRVVAQSQETMHAEFYFSSSYSFFCVLGRNNPCLVCGFKLQRQILKFAVSPDHFLAAFIQTIFSPASQLFCSQCFVSLPSLSHKEEEERSNRIK